MREAPPPNLSREQIRDLAPCPACGARAGEPCKRKQKKAGVNHHQRQHVAQLLRNAELKAAIR